MCINDEQTLHQIDYVEFLKPQLLHTSQKLTNTELSLLAKMDEEFMSTFMFYNSKRYDRLPVGPQTIENDMKELKLSESKSRYKLSVCLRNTFAFDRISVRDHEKI